MKRTEFLTLERLSGCEVTVFALYNDSSEVALLFSEVEVKYTNGSSFSCLDTTVELSYLNFNVVENVRVSRRDYDLSGVYWSGTDVVYDGTEKKFVSLRFAERSQCN